MREMKKILNTSITKIKYAHLPKQDYKDKIEYNLNQIYKHIKN
jgi:hypothetical protein